MLKPKELHIDLKLGHIFDKFYRSKEYGESEESGTGLGLAIAKEIVRIHIEITQLLFALGSTDVDDFISQTKYKFDRNNNVRIWSDDEKNIKFIVLKITAAFSAAS